MGDLHPFLAVGQELLRRGHRVTLVATPHWRAPVEEAGLEFAGCGPELTPQQFFGDAKVLSSDRLGLVSLQALMDRGIAPHLDIAADKLLELVDGYDLLMSHHFQFAGRTVHEVSGIPWCSVVLAPGITPSSEHYPKNEQPTYRWGAAGRLANRVMWWAGRRLAARVVDPPVNEHRRRYGLGPRFDLMFDGVISEQLQLLLYSPTFCPPAAEWPATMHQPGFCFYDQMDRYEPPDELAAFLEAGSPPWLFTLGTAAVNYPGSFYQVAAEVVRDLGQRAVFLLGNPENRPRDLPGEVVALDYAPYAWIMPRCGAVAHQCGAGTTAQALRAGLPSVAVPFAFDQNGNAALLRRHGIAEVVPAGSLSPERLRAAMERVLAGDAREKAAALGRQIAAEPGVTEAANLLEEAVERYGRSRAAAGSGG